MTMPHPAALPLDALLADCDVRRTRASGPGGQHRNKVETAVVVTHRPSGIAAEGTERRSQAQNQAAAVLRLRVKLALAVRAAWREASPLWHGRVTSRRMSVSANHDDFPALLAETLDALDANEWDAARTADALGVSTSQLVKLLKIEPAALALLNKHRIATGLRPLQ